MTNDTSSESDIMIFSESVESLCCVLLEQHGAPERFRNTAASMVDSTNAVMATSVDGNEIAQRCDQSLGLPF